ncbi:MAG: serine hydrolase domain-containing protein [Pseudolysinimonas sp.]
MLQAFVESTRDSFQIPGVAVGVFADGEESYACSGVTSIENPLPVTPETMFTLGSVTKVTTATTVMRLVGDGRIELDAPVHRYVPELRLADPHAAAAITIQQLLNHTSGLGLGEIVESDEADDALQRYVAGMIDLELIGKPGGRASYSQAGYDLLGRVVEKVTGVTYDQAVASLLFEPTGMLHSTFLSRDLLTRRFAVGHNLNDDGTFSVARLRKRDRGDNPGGGLDSAVTDQLRLARLHLADGRTLDDTQLIPAERVRNMRVPSTPLIGSSLGDAIGLCWFLRGLDGVQLVGHGGSTNGQFAEMLLAPERNFAIVSLSNAGPDGIPFNQAVVRWALEHYLDLIDRDPEPMPYDANAGREIVGRYDVDAMSLIIDSDGTQLTIAARIKPEIRAAASTELPPDYPAATLGLLPGTADEYVILDGGLKGQRGFFTRDQSGMVTGADLAGRLYSRVILDGPK